MTLGTDINPRFLAYCCATGEPDTERALARDRERYPGGHMAGFILWIADRWREWERENGRRASDNKGEADHESFDRWLSR